MHMKYVLRAHTGREILLVENSYWISRKYLSFLKEFLYWHTPAMRWVNPSNPRPNPRPISTPSNPRPKPDVVIPFIAVWITEIDEIDLCMCRCWINLSARRIFCLLLWQQQRHCWDESDVCPAVPRVPRSTLGCTMRLMFLRMSPEVAKKKLRQKN